MVKNYRSFGKLILTVIVIAVVMRPVLTDAQSTQGASMLTKTKNKIAYQVVAFDRLYFQYRPPMDIENPDGTVTEKSASPIPVPDQVTSLHETKVVLTGFVMPLETNGEYVKSFMLMEQLTSCLFCMGMGMDQWVLVTVNDPKGIRIKDEEYENPVNVYGTIQVGEKIEDGTVTSLYRLNADAVEITKQGLFNVF